MLIIRKLARSSLARLGTVRNGMEKIYCCNTDITSKKNKLAGLKDESRKLKAFEVERSVPLFTAREKEIFGIYFCMKTFFFRKQKMNFSGIFS